MRKYTMISFLILAISPLMGQEKSYFQDKTQTVLLSILGTIDVSPMFQYYTPNIYLQSFGGAKVDIMYRITLANVWGITSASLLAPVFTPSVPISPAQSFVSIGMGGFLFDKRDFAGIGSFMTMSGTFFFPLTLKYFSMGASIDTRYHYSFTQTSAFTIGLDIATRVSEIYDNQENSFLQILSFTLVLGFSFSAYEK